MQENKTGTSVLSLVFWQVRGRGCRAGSKFVAGVMQPGRRLLKLPTGGGRPF